MRTEPNALQTQIHLLKTIDTRPAQELGFQVIISPGG